MIHSIIMGYAYHVDIFLRRTERERERERENGWSGGEGLIWLLLVVLVSFPEALSRVILFMAFKGILRAEKKIKSGARTNFRFSKTPHQQMSMRIFAPSYDHFSVGSFLRYFLLCKTGKGRGLKLQSLTMNIFRARQRTIKKSRSERQRMHPSAHIISS